MTFASDSAALVSGTFTPQCHGSVSVSTVSTAATAYDWFLLNGASGSLATAFSAMSTSTSLAKQNKMFVSANSQLALLNLQPLVKAELFVSQFNNMESLISSSVTSIKAILTSIVNFPASASSLVTSYNSAVTGLNTNYLNAIKSYEATIYAPSTTTLSGSNDINSSQLIASINPTILTSFTGVKTYLGGLLDPILLGNGNAALPALTAVNGNAGNAAALKVIFTAVGTALTASTVADKLSALVETLANNVFDMHCMNVQGFMSSGTSGKYPTGATAPVGIVPGIDYLTFVDGTYNSGSAAAGTAGAPSDTAGYW